MTQTPLFVTIDGGPDPDWTGRFLDVLSWKGTRAAFMVTGEHAQLHPHLVERAVAEGHLLGIHSWDHADPFHQTPDEQRRQTERALATVTEIAGREAVRFWRAPYGHFTAEGVQHARDCGLRPLAWHVGAGDWRHALDLAKWEREADAALESPRLEWPLLEQDMPRDAAVLLVHDARCENHGVGSVDRWRSCQLLASLITRYPTIDPRDLA